MTRPCPLPLPKRVALPIIPAGNTAISFIDDSTLPLPLPKRVAFPIIPTGNTAISFLDDSTLPLPKRVYENPI